MKNKFMQIAAGTILGLLILLAGTQIFVSGQEEENAQRRRSIEGTWKTVVTQRNCQTGVPIRSFPGVLSFNQGGTLVGDSAVASPALKTASYGTWQRQHGRREYSFAFMLLLFNPDGTFAGTQEVTQTATLESSGDDFTTTGTLKVFDANGNHIVNGCATSTGTRFQ